ncbi:Vacuolar protein sorting-associated protein 17 [Spathaspora sp. JA1]|nr:Vacuolar protein sorting-associated protein 17 [Spathaspora sp. JA1]
MSFNPDEFENNNPFADPSASQIHQSEPIAPPVEVVPPDVLPAPTEREPEPDSAEQGNTLASAGQLTEAQLQKLIPERFTNKYQLHIRLTSIERNKPGNPILKMDAEIKGLPRFRQVKYKDIRRTFNEVVKFNKYLTIANLEVFVPVIPNANTSYPTNGEDEIKQLMMVWQEWLDRITSNPILIRDEEFVYFIENDFGYSVINSKRKSSVASGLMRHTLKQFSVPYDPYLELADFRPLIKSGYLICQKLYKLLDSETKTEKQLSIYIFELSNKLNVLAQFENSHPGMKNMWEKLGKIMQIQADLTLIESINDMGSLGDGVQTLVDDFYQIKEALTNRHLIMRELLQAESQTANKHAQANKIKSRSSLDPIKVDEAIRSLEYATKVEESLNLQVQRISGEMLYERQEIVDFTERKIQKLVKTFTLHKVEHHRKILKHLETIRLDIRIIDAKGGLSRLNRDNLANLKHNLAQSQSSKGDSWSSRTFRSLEKEQQERESEEEAAASKPDSSNTSNSKSNVVDAKNAASLLGIATF